MSTNPGRSGVLDRRLLELLSVGVSACRTHFDVEATRGHIRPALGSGATRDEKRLW